jgi:hypothetical protein
MKPFAQQIVELVMQPKDVVYVFDWDPRVADASGVTSLQVAQSSGNQVIRACAEEALRRDVYYEQAILKRHPTGEAIVRLVLWAASAGEQPGGMDAGLTRARRLLCDYLGQFYGFPKHFPEILCRGLMLAAELLLRPEHLAKAQRSASYADAEGALAVLREDWADSCRCYKLPGSDAARFFALLQRMLLAAMHGEAAAPVAEGIAPLLDRLATLAREGTEPKAFGT